MLRNRLTYSLLAFLLILIPYLYAADKKPSIRSLRDASGQLHPINRPSRPQGDLLRALNQSDEFKRLSAAEKVRVITKTFRNTRLTSRESHKLLKIERARKRAQPGRAELRLHAKERSAN